MTWDEAAKKLATFVDLADDWDGLGAVAPRLLVIEKALVLLRHLRLAGDLMPALPSPSRVGACPMGGIIFTWEQWGTYLEAEVTPTGNAEWMEEREGQPVRHGIGTVDGKIEWKEKP